jgi:hypothetical protein
MKMKYSKRYIYDQIITYDFNHNVDITYHGGPG